MHGVSQISAVAFTDRVAVLQFTQRLLTMTELGTAGFSRKECSRTSRGGPCSSGLSAKCACWNM